MKKTLVAALALVGCGFASGAHAQSSDASAGTGGGLAPTLIMPGLLTNPLTSGLDSEGSPGAGAPRVNETPDAAPRGSLLGGRRRDARSRHQLGE